MAIKRSSGLHLVFYALASCAWWSAAYAVTVHSWVGRGGVTQFSDIAPGSDVSVSREIHFDDIPPRSPSDDYYSIAKQWERVRVERDSSAAARLERELMKSQLTPASTAYLPPDPDASVDIYSGFRSPYGNFSRYPHRRYGHRHLTPSDMISPFNRRVRALDSKVALATSMRARLGGFPRQLRAWHAR